MSAPDPPEPFAAAPGVSSSPDGITPAATHGSTRCFEPFRFLQASDFRLDTPCYGVRVLPDRLRDRFVDARYLAVERVFDAAIEHNVDFLVLAGGLLDARLPGLRGPWFLAEQFRRLADHGIQIYWAGATFETPGRWPAHLEMPGNVYHMAADRRGILHRREGRPTAQLLTISPEEIDTFCVRGGGAFTIAVQPRSTRVPERWNAGVDYWALGGQPHHEIEQVGEIVAHFSGSPQGRSPAEPGRHSCSLVDVDSSGSVQIEPLETNVVRWQHERLNVPAATSWPELTRRMQRSLSQCHTDTTAEMVMVHFTVTGSGLTVQRLLEPQFNAELVNRLNAEGAKQGPAVWTHHIEAKIDVIDAADWCGPGTYLGAFLRELDEMARQSPEKFSAPRDRPPMTQICPAQTNERILQHVTSEGFRRLAPEAARSGQTTHGRTSRMT